MSTQIKYAYGRHKTWVYRRTYPKHLQPLLGSSLKQSLKTANATEAKARADVKAITAYVRELQRHNGIN